jgi:hypothetical protein
MVGWVVTAVAVLVVTVLVFVVSHHTLRSAGSQGAGMADAFGNFVDVFDPARSRADQDLKSFENQGEVLPSPDDDDRPMRIVDKPGRPQVVIRRPAPDETG